MVIYKLNNLLQKENFKNLCFVIVLYVLMILFYHIVSQGLENKNFYLQIRRYIPCMIAIYLLQYCTRRFIASKCFISHGIVGLSWIITYPLLYAITYHSTLTFYTNHQDMVFGLYIIVFLSALHYFMFYVFGKNCWTQGFISSLDVLMVVLPLLQVVYYTIYKVCISSFALMAIYQTDWNEAIEFFRMYIGYTGAAFILVGLACISMLFYRVNGFMTDRMSAYRFSRKAIIGCLILVVSLGIYLPFSLWPRVAIMEGWSDVRNYFASLQMYQNKHDERYEALMIHSEAALPTTVPGTVIIVIGESESRDFMSAYAEVSRDTTPWLRSKLSDPNFIVFQNAYSCWNQTVPVLERALTEVSQYNDKKFNESVSFVDIAKKLGYTTSWFSNQGVLGDADTPVTLVANTADRAQWTAQSIDTVQYDESLLDFLPQIDTTKNNFIVIHIMGSHGNYKNRYPSEFTKWGEREANIPTDDYDNALLHTDTVISKIYEYAKTNLNLQVMLYFADHGEGVTTPRNPDIINFSTVHIPLYLYISEAYQQAYPERVTALRKNQNAFFSNDMIYDTVCGILNSGANHYENKQDLSSSDYSFSKETVTTMLGKIHVTEDSSIK